ncbi:hypothetical protein [Streptomyces sp. NPDC058545]|uniref:hypothetical protein n=1 Tax=Streptomyces sp. NPDC058545 TaxID=3346544 RepID=UPI00364D5CE9
MTAALASPATASVFRHRAQPIPDPALLGIELPAAFRAFHALQQPAYRAYTAAHAPTSEVEDVTREAFGILAAHWSAILLRPDPSAYAWDLFTSVVRRRTKRLRLPANSPLQYEVVVLHHLTGCTPERIADATGRDLGKIHYLLRTWTPSKAAHART